MKFDFDTLADRKSMGNMKYIVSSDQIKNKGIVSYAGAEMDFKTAPVIINALKKRTENGLFGFTIADDKYYDSIIWWMKNQRDWNVERESIIPTYGTIHSVATAIRAFTEEGNGIIVQSPVYYRYEQAAKRLKRKIVYNSLIYKNGCYSMDFNNLERCMTDSNNKIMILCNPHNPVGRVWKKNELEEVASMAKKHNIIVFSDEIFSDIVFDNNKVIPYSLINFAEENCIVSTALGKTFNLTGFNNANIVIPNKNIREAFLSQRNADHFGSIDPFVYSSVCAAYGREGARWVEDMIKYLKTNINYIMNFFNENFPMVKIIEPEGTFTIWIDWNNMNYTMEELDAFLNNEAFLELDSGENYGMEGNGFKRMNIATPYDQIVYSLQLLKKAYNN